MSFPVFFFFFTSNISRELLAHFVFRERNFYALLVQPLSSPSSDPYYSTPTSLACAGFANCVQVIFCTVIVLART